MTKSTKRWMVVTGGVVIAFLLATGPIMYFGKEIRGRIVDEETKRPIEGAVVVAEWRLYAMNLASAGLGGTVKTTETVTTKDGEYVIPAWGPRPRVPWAFLLNHAPRMTFFKNGYYPDGGENREENRFDWVRSSDYDGQVVALRRFDGDFTKLSKALANTDPSGGLGCWLGCPLLVVALDAEAKTLRKIAPKNMWFAFPRELEDLTTVEQLYFNRFKK